jgi:hypothetical protein
MGIYRSKVDYEIISTQRSSLEMRDIKDVSSDHPVPSSGRRTLLKSVKNLILSGSVLEAIETLEINSPELIQPGSPNWVSLYSLHFIELIKQNLTMDALKFAQAHLGSYRNSKILTKGGVSVSVMELMGLLCYAAPKDSTLGFLLDSSQREITAAVVSESLAEENSHRCCNLYAICKKLCRRR